jgi:hypothetical protein
MTAQNFKNHTRIHPFYHYFTLPLSFGSLIFSTIRIFSSPDEHKTDSILLFIAFVLIFCAISLIRLYALKVQDRVIRAEENFRHFQLSGKQLDPKLRTAQIVALRFASDQEFPELAKRAVADKLKPVEIKKAITEWRPDYKRI